LRLAAKAAILAVLAFAVTANAAPVTNPQSARNAEIRKAAKYPPKPTWADFKARATATEYSTLRRIAVCEEGGSGSGEPWNVRWGFQASRYSSAFGIWNGNFAYTRQVTKYNWPTSNKAEEAFHALALARRYGFSAWGCY